MLKNIYKKLGIEVDLQSSQTAFINKTVNKVNNLLVFHKDGENIFDELSFQVCNELGLKYSDFSIYKTKRLINYDLKFSELLLRLQILIKLSNSDILSSEEVFKARSVLLSIIIDSLKESPVELGYAVKEYKNKPPEIYKKGVSFLDEKVVFDVLDWLESYPKAKTNYSDALKFFLQKNYANSLTNSYSALESVAKQVLKTEARLDKPEIRNRFTTKLGLDQSWGKILSNFSEISHEFSTRHGGNSSIDCTEEQAEFYLYQTGTYLRLISKTIF